MRMRVAGVQMLACLAMVVWASASAAAERFVYVQEEKHISRVDRMPDVPQPFVMRPWRQVALDCDALLFNFDAKGPYLPLIWEDNSRVNADVPDFGLPAFVGKASSEPKDHEGSVCIGAVLGGTLVGVDKTKGRMNYVLACTQYFDRTNGEHIIMNNIVSHSGGSFWYELYPTILFYGVADKYPKVPQLQDIMKTTSDRWFEAFWELGGKDGKPNFDHRGYNHVTRQAQDGGWTEPDAGAAVAWIQYMAYVRFGDPKYFYAADHCLRYLQDRRDNPYYEILMPFGALAAARMNAEHGRAYDLPRFLNWCFDGDSPARPGWGVVADKWGNVDCHGLVGGIWGYAFAMNTFVQPAALVPIARYDPRFTRAIGKYVFNAANAARLYYSAGLSQEHQSTPRWEGDPKGVVAFEGLKKEEQGKSPFATGDARSGGWAPTDLGIYGSSTVGLLGGLIAPTNDSQIIQIDCLATDFFHAPAYPTYLYYNSYNTPRPIEIDVGPRPRDLYDAVSKRFLARKVSGKTTFTLPAAGALVVLAPAGGKVARDGYKVLIDGVVVDYMGGPFLPE